MKADPNEDRSRLRIVDLVFAGEPRGHGRRLAAGMAVVLVLYGGAVVLVARLGRSASDWSIEMSARIHDLVAAERAVDVSPPPPPAPALTPPPEARQPPATVERARNRSAVAPRPSRPAPPAQAGKLAAMATEPVDFTGTAFVIGSGSNYAGGTTSASGASRAPVTGAAVPGGTGSGAATAARAPILARPVSLDQAAWVCPWPDQADAQQIDEQTVVIRARVRPDGGVASVDILSDPGYGFAEAARLCALRTRFQPAHDGRGQTVAALSPPIRVHFFR